MWLLTEWQHFNAQREAEEKRALKIREYRTLNEILSQKNLTIDDVVEFTTNKNNSHQTHVELGTTNSNQDATVAAKGGAIPKIKKQHTCLSDKHNYSDNSDNRAGQNKAFYSDIIDYDDDYDDDYEDEDDNDDVFQPDDAMTFFQRKALLYRIGLGIIAIVSCVCILSLPQVPEKFLGIRSPQRVLMEYRLTPHPSNDSILHPVEVNQSHSIRKRHIRVPHKFWAKARPHNKFKKKKRYAHPQLQAPPEAPAHGPVHNLPNPQLVVRH